MSHKVLAASRPAGAPIGLIRAYCLLLGLLTLFGPGQASAAETATEVPLVIGNRTIHVFRAGLGAFSASDRADGARRRIEQALEASGEGWTSVKSTDGGTSVALDGKPMFYVLPGDARELAGETPDDLANQASRVLQKIWAEARERRDPQVNLAATLKVLLASVLLAGVLTMVTLGARWIRHRLTAWLGKRLTSVPTGNWFSRVAILLPVVIRRLSVLVGWLLGLFALLSFLTYSLGQFVFTRPASENLSQSISQLLMQSLHGVTDSLPGLFVSALIFLVAWVVTRVSTEIFAHAEAAPIGTGMLNAHTAPATRRIVNASLWLFAVAMAYPYLPGSHTQAFQGLSVILGLMVSIGASGLVGQIASGLMLVYTNALLVGEYVRIQDCEGTVTELGLFVTRLRTGLGEEIALPNSLVLANVTRNFSRVAQGKGFVLDTTITIGYDTPWRQVHALLLESSDKVREILKSPAPFVVQSALSDFYVAYKLVVYVDSEQPARRALVASDLHAAIQDTFNRYGVQIMSPQYFIDPATPKLVPESNWYASPARRPEAGRVDS
jgi:small-conductance mechanosensitive channel